MSGWPFLTCDSFNGEYTHALMYSNALSAARWSVWEVRGTFRRRSLAEGGKPLGWALVFSGFFLLLLVSLCALCDHQLSAPAPMLSRMLPCFSCRDGLYPLEP